MVQDLISQSPGDRSIWPGRYQVRAEITYRDRRGKPSTLQVIHFQPDMTDDEALTLLVPLGIIPETKDFHHFVSQARDTFSSDQAEALVAYLNRRKGTHGVVKPAHVSLPGLLGASAITKLPSLRDRSVYKLYLEPDYNLDFRVEAVNIKVNIHLARFFREIKEHENFANGIHS